MDYVEVWMRKYNFQLVNKRNNSMGKKEAKKMAFVCCLNVVLN